MSASSERTASFRNLPSKEHCIGALRYFYDRRPRKSIRTLIFKLVIHSKKQERNLLKAHTYVTQLTHRVLESLREDSKQERTDGAFALFLEMLDVRAVKGEQASDKSTTLGNLIGKYFNKNHLTREDYYFSVTLRDGVYREAAKTIMNWCVLFLTIASDDELEGTRSPFRPSLREAYQAWRVYVQAFDHALRTPFPFGRNKGRLLKAVGRRELRWLIERLPPEDVVSKTRRHLEILIGIREPQNAEELEQAKMAEHPWRRQIKHERAVRERRINTRTYDLQGDHILLESLSDEEKERLYDELLDLDLHHIQYAEVRQAVETVLSKRPPRFPSVATVAAVDDEEAAQHARHDYWATLDWFRSAFPQRPSKPLDEYALEELEELEAEAVTRLLRASSALELPKFQPICFKRSMRPKVANGYRSFGLLRDSATREYVLALALSGKESRKQSNRTKELADVDRASFKGIEHFTPQVGENLEFFNFSLPFQPPPNASIILCSLQYDQEYHHEKYLQPLYERLRATPAVVSRLDNDNDGSTADTAVAPDSDDYLDEHVDTTNEANMSDMQNPRKGVKRAPIGSARITCSWTKECQPEFFLHLPVPVFETTPPEFPETVLGLHEHETGLSYAIISFTGEVIEMGDLAIEPSVLPRIGQRTYNPNFANAVAVAILELAQKHKSFIGIEETSQFRQSGISRTRNRRFFGRPSKRIAEIVGFKALEYGLLPPRMVWKVAPSRDCSQCGYRLDEGTSGIRRVAYVGCPTCALRQPLQNDDMLVQTCVGCGHLWRTHEAWVEQEFVCTRCHAMPMLHARILLPSLL